VLDPIPLESKQKTSKAGCERNGKIAKNRVHRSADKMQDENTKDGAQYREDHSSVARGEVVGVFIKTHLCPFE
jgi:hypothetical protein